MIIVRPIELKDVPTCVSLGKQMHEESLFRVCNFSERKCAILAKNTMNNPDMLAIVAETRDTIVGMLFAELNRTYFGEELATRDLLIYVLPDKRGTACFKKLIKFYSDWSEEVGAKLCFLSSSTGMNVSSLYKKVGFSQIGGIFLKGE